MSLLSNMSRLNYTSISKVCSTDPSSVELVLKEIIAQMSNMIKHNATLRISFRIGRIEVKNQEINWKQFAEDFDRNVRSLTTIKDNELQKRSLTDSRYSRLGGHTKKCSQFSNDELSVKTPFTILNSKTMASNRAASIFNISNPNPQNGDVIFKGARDVGYNKFYEGQPPMNEVVKFGKKVDYYKKMSNDQLMQDHLK